MQTNFNQHVLRTDVSGMPLGWVTYREAVRRYHLGQVLYSCGNILYEVHGGVNAITGEQSTVAVNSIIATEGESHSTWHYQPNYTPPLTNQTLFLRDNYICLYCGDEFSYNHLSCDHITPISQRGSNHWNNVVTACKRCNNFKAGRTPEQAGMQLLAVPFTPTHAEYLYLRGRRILTDQMAFLKTHFPRTSPLRERMA